MTNFLFILSQFIGLLKSLMFRLVIEKVSLSIKSNILNNEIILVKPRSGLPIAINGTLNNIENTQP